MSDQNDNWRLPENLRELRSQRSYDDALRHNTESKVPYGVDSAEDRALVAEIERRRSNGISLKGLSWPASDDPYHPANDKNHPYYLKS